MWRIAFSSIYSEEYQTLLENLRGLATLAERRDEPVFDHADVVSKLKTDSPISPIFLSYVPCFFRYSRPVEHTQQALAIRARDAFSRQHEPLCHDKQQSLGKTQFAAIA